MNQPTNCLYTEPEINEQNDIIINACKKVSIQNISQNVTHSFLALPQSHSLHHRGIPVLQAKWIVD